MLKYLLAILLSSFIFPYCYASDIHFKNINSDAGLSQNNVKSIYQDSYGFLWFGTRNKLNRYDGNAIKIFDCYDKEKEKGDNNIGVIFEDSDRKLWLGTDKGVYIFDPVYETFSFFDTTSQNGIIINDWISSIQKDAQNNIWIIVPNQGVFKYEDRTKILHMYSVVKTLLPSVSNPQCMAIGDDGQVWIGTNGSGIYKYDKDKNTFKQYIRNNGSGISLENKNIYSMAYYKGELFIGIHEENLLKFDIRTQQFVNPLYTGPNNKIIRKVSIINDNELWVSTQSGIYIINLKNHQEKHVEGDFLDATSLSDNLIETIYQDREGNIWIGTRSGGVNYLPKTGIKFNNYFPGMGRNPLSSRKVRSLVEDENKNIWVGTEDAGVFLLPADRSQFQKMNNLHYTMVLSLMKNKDDMWVGYFKNGLDVLSLKNRSQKPSYYSSDDMGLNEESVYALCKDRKGNIWLGNAWGVFLARSGSMKFERQTQFGMFFTQDIAEDRDGNIWLTTMGRGVFRYDPETKTTTHFTTGHKENTLSSNSISSITVDHRGRIWFSTDRGGVCVYNKSTNEFKRYSIKNGLPDDVAYKIVEDRQHNLWFGTNNGLVKLNPENDSIMVFTKDNGLPSNQFNYNSGLITSDNEIFFGSSNGLVSFNPHDLKRNNYISPVYINSLFIFNDEVKKDSPDPLLHKSMIHTKQLTLPYNKTNITLGFVSLCYSSPKSNQFVYMMEGVDEGWIRASATQTASYSNLAPGKYRFKVKGSNSDGLWNPEETYLDILVTPPWWRSTVAYIIYTILLLVILFVIIKTYTKKYKERMKQEQEMYRMKQEKDLYEDKVNFFTNIAHEIRTPLTLIHMPLESLLEYHIEDKTAKEYLNIIEHNTENLLLLVNQLFDFKKIGGNKPHLHWQKVDIIDLVNQIIFLFKAQVDITNKEINLHTNNHQKLEAIVDRKELFKIINNLVSNAVKYSSSQIDIYIDKDTTNFSILVKNDGNLISEIYQDKIFNPFFRVKEGNDNILGSGIGLSLAQSLTEMHSGTLKYSTTDNFNNFTLTIPLYHEYSEDDQEAEESPSDLDVTLSKNDTDKDGARITILLVEDNPEILGFLKNRLKDEYNVLVAADGVEALEVLSSQKVDVTITDIMMPRMDGFALCQHIKNDENLSHTIVLLLTAKSDLNSKIKGLELGADAYIEKPFSVKYLSTLINSLIANRIRDTNIFMKKPIAFSKQLSMNKVDEEFVNKLNNIIQKNLSDPEFNVIMLAENLNISRSGLHRKITEILSTSPVEYIRLCRLQKAADLISEGSYRINEIAYMIGINTPSYFIKIFQAHYGMTPKEYEEHIRDNLYKHNN